MSDVETFPETALRQLSFLLHEYGFRIAAEDAQHVRLESLSLGVEAWHDPRGEVEVRAFRLGNENRDEVWTHTGMVGKASVSRLLEIAGEQMVAEPAILAGDAKYYEQRGAENRSISEAWTAYYSGSGPRPTGNLP